MAQKRMFDKRVVESDKFTDLPNSSKALYFIAGMSADDKGFFQPRRLQKMHGFSDDDFKILIAKGYFIPFESGVIVITDWNKNNWLDSRRITETEYVDELNLLKLINERYELENSTNDTAKQMLSQNRIEENRIDNKYMSSEIDEIIDYLNQPDTDEPIRSFKKTSKSTRSKITARFKDGFTVDDLKDVIFFKYNQWVKKPVKFTNGMMSDTYYRPDTLFSTHFENYLQEYKESIK